MLFCFRVFALAVVQLGLSVHLYSQAVTSSVPSVQDQVLRDGARSSLLSVTGKGNTLRILLTLKDPLNRPIMGWGKSPDSLAIEEWREFLRSSVYLNRSIEKLDVKEHVNNAAEFRDIVVVVDFSSSMTVPRLRIVGKALDSLRRQLGAGDKLTVVRFSGKVLDVREYQPGMIAHDLGELAALETPMGSAVFDGLHAAINSFSDSPVGNRAIILCSDGVDNKSKGSASTLEGAMLAKGAKLFHLHLGSISGSALFATVRESGGEMIKLFNNDLISRAFVYIADAINHSYELNLTFRSVQREQPPERLAITRDSLVLMHRGVLYQLKTYLPAVRIDVCWQAENLESAVFTSPVSPRNNGDEIGPAEKQWLNAIATILVQNAQLNLDIRIQPNGDVGADKTSGREHLIADYLRSMGVRPHVVDVQMSDMSLLCDPDYVVYAVTARDSTP